MVDEADNDGERTTPRSPALSQRAPDPTIKLDMAIAGGNLSLPTHFGRYQVVNRIGVGGFASVYSALDPDLDSLVAIKVLAENHSANVAVRKRFVAEARVARRLGSDRLVGVFDLGETDDGRPFVVMELAERGTLRQRLVKTGRPSHDDLVRLIDELGSCMTAVHEQGVVHRDIKPSNLLFRVINPPGTPKATKLIGDDERLVLADFGLARDISEGASAITVGGGTEGYMAPEQADPRGKADYRADIYSATVVMAELTTGRHPERLDLTTADISTDMLDALTASLSIDRDKRPHTAADWRDRLLSAYRSHAGTGDYGSHLAQLDTARIDPTKVQAPYPYNTEVGASTEIPHTGMREPQSFVGRGPDGAAPPPPPGLPVDPALQPPPPHRAGPEPAVAAGPDPVSAPQSSNPTGASAVAQQKGEPAVVGQIPAVVAPQHPRDRTRQQPATQVTPPTAQDRTQQQPLTQVTPPIVRDQTRQQPPTHAAPPAARDQTRQQPPTYAAPPTARDQTRQQPPTQAAPPTARDRTRPGATPSNAGAGTTAGVSPQQAAERGSPGAVSPPPGPRPKQRPIGPATSQPPNTRRRRRAPKRGAATDGGATSPPPNTGGRRRGMKHQQAAAATGPALQPPTPGRPQTGIGTIQRPDRPGEVSKRRSKQHLRTAERLAKLERKQNRKRARSARRRRRRLRVVNFVFSLIRGMLAATVAWFSGAIIAAVSLGVPLNKVGEALQDRDGAQVLLLGGTFLAFLWGLAYFPFPRSYEI